MKVWAADLSWVGKAARWANYAYVAGDAMRIELANCTKTLLGEIADKGFKQKSVAMTYALVLRSDEPTDWKIVNRAIIDRWSVSGLNRIKKVAWSGKCFD